MDERINRHERDCGVQCAPAYYCLTNIGVLTAEHSERQRFDIRLAGDAPAGPAPVILFSEPALYFDRHTARAIKADVFESLVNFFERLFAEVRDAE